MSALVVCLVDGCRPNDGVFKAVRSRVRALSRHKLVSSHPVYMRVVGCRLLASEKRRDSETGPLAPRSRGFGHLPVEDPFGDEDGNEEYGSVDGA